MTVTLTDLMRHTETRFEFLKRHALAVVDRLAPTGDSARDGWRLIYESPVLRVVVEYLDMQFSVIFTHRGTAITYLSIDREVYGRKSGLYGDMFPRHKVSDIIDRLSLDISTNYSPILNGDPAIWQRLAKLLTAPPRTPKLP